MITSFHCTDCNTCILRNHEYYVVEDNVWPLDKFGGMLCIVCIEVRIGRRLTPADFKIVLANIEPGPRSKRLQKRMGNPGFTIYRGDCKRCVRYESCSSARQTRFEWRSHDLQS